jgi:hypothetical protein
MSAHGVSSQRPGNKSVRLFYPGCFTRFPQAGLTHAERAHNIAQLDGRGRAGARRGSRLAMLRDTSCASFSY